MSSVDSSAELIRALKSIRNPFRGAVVGDPWATADDAADVDRIHQEVFRTCCEAVDHVRSGGGSAGLIINGEAGSGKTHLIRRLRRQMTEQLTVPVLERTRQAFACVRLDTSATSVARHVRRRVADDLLRSFGTGPSQFEVMVISRLMHLGQQHGQGQGDLMLWWEHFCDQRLDELDELLAELNRSEALSPTFVRILSHLVSRRHRLDVAGWLRGDALSSAALERLELAADESDDDPEDVAREWLVDLMRLAGVRMPLVLCFDQVEALQTSAADTEALFAFGQLVSQLHDATCNLVLISCMQSSMFQQIRQAVPAFCLDRMQSYAVQSLNPLDEMQAELLIRHRLRSTDVAFLRPADESNIWPFDRDDIRRFIGATGCTPRRLLDQAARHFDSLRQVSLKAGSGSPASLEIQMQREWEHRLELASQHSIPGRSGDILRGGLPNLIFLAEPGWQTASDTEYGVLDYVITAPHGEARVGVRICDESPQRLVRQLGHLVGLFPARMNLHKLVLLRDDRRPIGRKAITTQRHLAALQESDAVFCGLAPESFAALHAIQQLLADAKAGDLDFDGTTISADTVIEWLRRNMPPSIRDLADILLTPAAGRHDRDTELVSRLQEFLDEQRLSSVADAATELQTDPSALIRVAAARSDLFGLLEGPAPVVFAVRHGSQAVDQAVTQ